MKVWSAVGVVLLGLLLLWMGRYQIEESGAGFLRLDRFTGQVCIFDDGDGDNLEPYTCTR